MAELAAIYVGKKAERGLLFPLHKPNPPTCNNTYCPMAPTLPGAVFLCHRCAGAVARERLRPQRLARHMRPYSTDPSKTTSEPATATDAKEAKKAKEPKEPKEPSAMSRRLEEATEEALLTGGRAGRRAVEEAGFSDELKERLFNKIADVQFRAEHGAALSEAGLDTRTSSAAGAGTWAMATGAPWTGEEATADTVLRMLDDARKPLAPGLRGRPKIPDPVVVDLRLRRPATASPGQRVASARERAEAYAGGKRYTGAKKNEKEGKGLNESEREALREEFRDRFGSAVRGAGASMPNSITGLAALANERIEDAIARGQFRDIPRGPGVERDTRADNPFVDTTEYIMNKMIQRQAIVPPWIEKQQELVRAARAFRAQLRTDWQRQAARSLASRGGTLTAQMALAERYARAERAHNPRQRDVEQIAVATIHTDDAVVGWQRGRGPEAKAGVVDADTGADTGPDIDLLPPLREPGWEAAERAYLERAIAHLNGLTRSYNLMAPELAKKPYFTLDRELRACYADVAPTLAQTIRDRAARPARRPASAVPSGRRVLGQLLDEGGPRTAHVRDSRTPHYGFKEMWRDMWKKDA